MPQNTKCVERKLNNVMHLISLHVTFPAFERVLEIINHRKDRIILEFALLTHCSETYYSILRGVNTDDLFLWAGLSSIDPTTDPSVRR